MNTNSFHTSLVVNIREDGTLVCLNHEETSCFKELGKVKTRRASHVEPYTRRYRIAFHMLRFLFGEKGRVSDWTRNGTFWRSRLWRVNLTPIGGPILPGGMHPREAALRAEVEWLDEHLT
jgi:hypothetical protein